MKMILGAALAALSLAACQPADAAQVRVDPSVTITVGNDPYYGDYRGDRYDRYNRKYRNNRFMGWRFFSRQPTYYPGRCNLYRNVIVRDPYSGRRVCMNRGLYNRYMRERYYRY